MAFFFHLSTRQVTLGGLDEGLVFGCREGRYKYFPSGYVLLGCNLMVLAVVSNNVLMVISDVILKGVAN